MFSNYNTSNTSSNKIKKCIPNMNVSTMIWGNRIPFNSFIRMLFILPKTQILKEWRKILTNDIITKICLPLLYHIILPCIFPSHAAELLNFETFLTFFLILFSEKKIEKNGNEKTFPSTINETYYDKYLHIYNQYIAQIHTHMEIIRKSTFFWMKACQNNVNFYMILLLSYDSLPFCLIHTQEAYTYNMDTSKVLLDFIRLYFKITFNWFLLRFYSSKVTSLPSVESAQIFINNINIHCVYSE